MLQSCTARPGPQLDKATKSLGPVPALYYASLARPYLTGSLGNLYPYRTVYTSPPVWTSHGRADRWTSGTFDLELMLESGLRLQC